MIAPSPSFRLPNPTSSPAYVGLGETVVSQQNRTFSSRSIETNHNENRQQQCCLYYISDSYLQGVKVVTLEDRLQEFDNTVQMMRSAPSVRGDFLYPPEHSGWLDEQWAWKNTAVLFNQSFHMDDFIFKGPDVKRLMSDTGINSFANFGQNKAKQFVAVNHDGYVIGDAVLFAFEEDRYHLVGGPMVGAWVQYQAEVGDYDVEVIHDARSREWQDRQLYRYQVSGPATQDILEKAQGRSLEPIKFFNMGTLTIAGKTVRALNHGMAKVPGRIDGLELMGPVQDVEPVVNAILEAGEGFGLRRAGQRAYASASAESGWFAPPVPAIYTSDKMKPYRQWLPSHSWEGMFSLDGSFESDNIEDYYTTPWDLGYGHLVKFDHDFIGRDALEAIADQPHRKKVYLEWHNDDASRVLTESLFKKEGRPREIDVPGSVGSLHFDKVTKDERLIGVSGYVGYTFNNGCFVSLAIVDEGDAQDGVEVTVIWGEDDGGASKPMLQPHLQTTIRATLRTKSPAS